MLQQGQNMKRSEVYFHCQPRHYELHQLLPQRIGPSQGSSCFYLVEVTLWTQESSRQAIVHLKAMCFRGMLFLFNPRHVLPEGAGGGNLHGCLEVDD